MVAKDQVYDLRLTMSGKGLPAGQDTGYALLEWWRRTRSTTCASP